MGDRDAEERFFEAVNNFRTADEKARSDFKIDEQAFQMVIIDLDAAIPGLTGVTLGRALVLRAGCLYWLHLAKLSRARFFDVTAPRDPLLTEGLAYALKGRKILEEAGSARDLAWADDLVEKLSAQ